MRGTEYTPEEYYYHVMKDAKAGRSGGEFGKTHL
ncbi:hypothetical protein Tco_0538799, partial [Tanacetum coccineum]